MFQAFVVDGQTGAIDDMIPVTDFRWEKALSAGSSGTCSVPLDGTHTQAQLGDLFRHWRKIFVLVYNNRALFGGYVTSHTYKLGDGVIQAHLTDLWGLTERRLAVDGSAPNAEKWSLTETVAREQHASNALIRARDTFPSDPDPRIPVTIPGFSSASAPVKRSWFGYHFQTVNEVWRLLMDEGLDIYFEPRWIGNGDFDWIMRAGMGWQSGKEHEFYVNVPESDVSGFSTTYDGARITTAAYRLGEGSEQDMLARSDRKLGSIFPRLDRVTASKKVSDAAQLAALADNDLVMYRSSTAQWEFEVPVSTGIEPGDLVTLNFDGDPVIPSGFTTRRVVSVSGDMSEFMTVRVQPAGGA